MRALTVHWAAQYLGAVSSFLSRMQNRVKKNSGKRKKKTKDGLRRDRKQLLVEALQPHSAHRLPKGSGTGV